jgi:hypothetical protein
VKLLAGRSGGALAKAMCLMVKTHGLDTTAAKPVERAAKYLVKHTRLFHYDRALADGLPIATGVTEGACRYLVQDRMGRTGARWSLVGAEAVLRRRALRASGDFDDYWQFHSRRSTSELASHATPTGRAQPAAVAPAASEAVIEIAPVEPRHKRAAPKSNRERLLPPCKARLQRLQV